MLHSQFVYILRKRHIKNALKPLAQIRPVKAHLVGNHLHRVHVRKVRVHHGNALRAEIVGGLFLVVFRKQKMPEYRRRKQLFLNMPKPYVVIGKEGRNLLFVRKHVVLVHTEPHEPFYHKFVV